MNDILFDASNAAYAQDLYERYAKNPDSVPEAWRRIFKEAALTQEAGLLKPEALGGNGRYAPPVAPPAPPAVAPSVPAPAPAAAAAVAEAPPPRTAGAAAAAPVATPTLDEHLLRVVARGTSFVQAFRDHGHQLALLDPLGSEPPGHPQLDPEFFGTSMEELERIPSSVVLGPDAEGSLASELRLLQQVYCGSMGFQFEHLEDPVRAQWLWDAVETRQYTQSLTEREKIGLLQRLTETEGFEQFLHRTYLGQKRFSLEGTDMLVPMLDEAIREGARDGAEQVVLGMAHRGRLNVLTHIVGVPYESMLASFEGAPRKALGAVEAGTGDVKYHHGASGTYLLEDGSDVAVRLAPNPSHLEFVNPVVEGMARAEQLEFGDQNVRSVIPIVIHGDAAFAAEGVVAETLNLARLAGYRTGGTIHIIVNNQIGFTTEPQEGRSTRYSSDLAKGYDIPVLHVNADDPEACLGAIRLSMAYRAQFHDDILIDLIGYRRHGHNEGDEPAYTQPRQYEIIRSHPTVRALWAQRLIDEGVVSEAQSEQMKDDYTARLRAVQEVLKADDSAPPPPEPGDEAPRSDVPVLPWAELAELNRKAFSWSDDFTVHPKLVKQLERRVEGFGPEARLDWAHAETLAFASLLAEGIPVRFSGQDAERGTFSQRHLVLHDAKTGSEWVPLQEMGGARFEVYNSPLTETAVLGFEYGYSVAADRDLVLWEAQFGDFVNVAQVILDQFISSGATKWDQHSRLVLLLPHGHEGQGPEHSSARLERFLQLCAEENIRVAYPTTPAQHFHLLRRQAHTLPEHPLVVMTPKSLLRLPAAASPAAELSEGRFQPLLDDPVQQHHRERVRRLVLCSGKFYYDLSESELRSQASDVAIARVEQLYPFPGEELEDLVRRYPALDEVVWAQEEPRNMGALSFVGPRLRVVIPRTIPLRHVSRPERASPAEGKAQDHNAEQARLVHDALVTLEGR
ncbi:MAG: 2-oxoglutarate dehydrogenase E1 component [Gemmatimonadota bacterium]